MVGLSRRLINAYPHEPDGEEGREWNCPCLIRKPEFIVMDEPVSAPLTYANPGTGIINPVKTASDGSGADIPVYFSRLKRCELR